MSSIIPARRVSARSYAFTVTAFVLLALLAPAAVWSQTGKSQQPQVLRVGTFNNIPGQYEDIQAAVDAAEPGDFVLVGPGDYHPSGNGGRAGVYITTPGITLRGMDRNTTIIDGTLASSDVVCSDNADLQNLGPEDADGEPMGRNGIWVFEADDVEIQNLTVCNFLTGTEEKSGNEIYFDGDEDTPIGLHAWCGEYLSATSTFYSPDHRGEYGLFASSSDGPGMFVHTYASNFADSAYYIGACPDCNTLIDDAHAQNNALGYSGTNSGGRLIIRNSEWDHNKTGIVTNTQSVGDPPPPQDGTCPPDVLQQDFVDLPKNVATDSCWVARNNYIHDNNNPNVPKAGIAATGPVGTGMVIAGGRNDIVLNNRIENNKAWGILLTFFPDQAEPAGGSQPPTGEDQKQPDCGPGVNVPNVNCIFNVGGVEVVSNTFSDNGGYGNLGNGDMAELSITDPGTASNCWHDNSTADGGRPSSDPPLLQITHGACDGANLLSILDLDQAINLGTDPPNLLIQVACNTGALFDCPDTALASYPRQTEVVLLPRPDDQPTMPDPCAGVPDNPWCPAGRGQEGDGV